MARVIKCKTKISNSTLLYLRRYFILVEIICANQSEAAKFPSLSLKSCQKGSQETLTSEKLITHAAFIFPLLKLID